MKSPLFIYVHGFNSSPDSAKARLLGEFFKACHEQIDYRVPQLSHWPAKAMQQLKNLIEAHRHRPVILIGSSLGGFYSLWLTEHYANCRAVLVNPAIYPYRLLADWLGNNENIYTHETYELTREHLSQLEALAMDRLADPNRYLLLVQTADETLDYTEAVDFLAGAPQFVQSGGSHGFDQFEVLMPAILQFSQGKIALPDAIPLRSTIP